MRNPFRRRRAGNGDLVAAATIQRQQVDALTQAIDKLAYAQHHRADDRLVVKHEHSLIPVEHYVTLHCELPHTGQVFRYTAQLNGMSTCVSVPLPGGGAPLQVLVRIEAQNKVMG